MKCFMNIYSLIHFDISKYSCGFIPLLNIFIHMYHIYHLSLLLHSSYSHTRTQTHTYIKYVCTNIPGYIQAISYKMNLLNKNLNCFSILTPILQCCGDLHVDHVSYHIAYILYNTILFLTHQYSPVVSGLKTMLCTTLTFVSAVACPDVLFLYCCYQICYFDFCGL